MKIHFLPQNGVIGFCAPSLGVAGEPYATRFENAKNQLRTTYTLWQSESVAKETFFASAPAKTRAKEVEEAFTKADAVLSVGGGERMMEILPYLRFSKLKKQAKLFLGYSDNTVLTYTLPTICDVAAVYGYCAPTFGRTPWHESILDTLLMLQGKKEQFCGYSAYEMPKDQPQPPLAPYQPDTPSVWKFSRPLEVQGRILGGCLDVLRTLVGTPFDKTKAFLRRYERDGVLWFLENCEMSPFDVLRTLWQCKQAGWFRTAKAFVFGRTAVQFAPFGMDFITAVKEVLGKDAPLVWDADFGHVPPSMPVLMGAKATLCVNEKERFVRYNFSKEDRV